MKTTIELKPNNIKLVKVVAEGEEVKKLFDLAVDYYKKDITVEGFRKGQAPSNLARLKIDATKLNNKVIDDLFKESLEKILKDHNLKPIASPKLKVEKITETLFEGTLTIIERPLVTLGDYKKAAKLAYKLTEEEEAKQQKDKKEDKTKPEDKKTKKQLEEEEEHNKIHQFEHKLLENIYTKLIELSKIDLSEELIQDETNRLLNSFLTYLSKLGIKFEDYLKQTGVDIAKIQEDYKNEAEKNLKIEFLLSEIVKKEKITVTDTEIQEAIDNTPDENYKKELQKPANKYYIESQLLKQKAVRKLLELSGFNHFH